MKLTEWYPGDVKPVRVGVYQQQSGIRPVSIGYQYWDGSFWNGWFKTAEMAFRFRRSRVSISHQNDPWRGVAK